ncbi:hypothetical protein quinque_004242 [Culex quinquefasciatus]
MILWLMAIMFVTAVSTGQPQTLEPTNIINGQPAADKQFPHQWVVTAAHCFINADVFLAIMGTNTPLPIMDDGRVMIVGNEFYIHEKYDENSFINDVALVKLLREVQFNARIRPIRIATGSRNYYGEMGVASGWGQTTDDSDSAIELQYATLKVISNQECVFVHFGLVHPSTLCAAGSNHESTCYGDSGGPLVSLRDGTLIGITSFGSFISCQRGIPVGFTRVTSHFPYQAMLIIQMGKERSLCGGSLLSDEWVLTAGHCVEDAQSILVTLGAVEFREPADGDGRVVQNSTEFIRHEDYDPGTASNDVALVKLPQKVEFNDRIRPVALPTGHDDYNRRMAIASGWGKTKDRGGIADRLQYVSLKVITNNECSLLYPGTVQPTTLCTHNEERKSTCNGDSGGPLVLEDDHTLIGATSFGHIIGCEKRLPVAFARITEYVDWIRNKTGMAEPQ